MLRTFITGIALLMLNACQAQDARYYELHPQELQRAIKNCPAQSPGKISCDELKKVARKINSLAYELQMNPQGFGSKIIALQEELVQQQEQFAQHPKEQKLAMQMKQNQEQLAQRLAIVRWLESP